MDGLASPGVFLFDGFRLDRRTGGLFRRDETGAWVLVPIGSRPLDVLCVLLERVGDPVSKNEILAAAWSGAIVDDSNLTVQISALRRVLDQDRLGGSCIQTVAGHGYRFVAPITRCEAAEPPARNDQAGGDESRVADEPGQDPANPTSSVPIAWPRCRRAIAIAAAFGAMLALAVGAWRLWPMASPSATPQAVATASIPQVAVAPRLSIVVLPFANLSNNPDQQYFADGITDDLTTDLSRITDMFVIARNTAFTYRNKPADAKQIGRELGVRYLLEGSVQQSGNQLRVNAQLVDAETGAHLWAERFERDTSDLFALQNEITTRIAIALHQEIVSAEAARRTESPDVLDYLLRARAAGMKPPSRDYFTEVIGLLERALVLDPHSPRTQAELASWLAGRVLANMTGSAAADIERAKALTEQALAASPRSISAHIAKAHLLRAQRRYAEAIPEYETALAYNRNYVYAYFALGQCRLFTGSIEEAIPLIERAIRLSPRDPQLGVWSEQIGVVYLLQSRTDEGVTWLEKARNHSPAHSMIRGDLAAAYGLAGETERAVAELAEARRLSPDDRYSSIARYRAVRNYGALLPKIRTLYESTVVVGLLKAGMPEE